MLAKPFAELQETGPDFTEKSLKGQAIIGLQVHITHLAIQVP